MTREEIVNSDSYIVTEAILSKTTGFTVRDIQEDLKGSHKQVPSASYINKIIRSLYNNSVLYECGSEYFVRRY